MKRATQRHRRILGPSSKSRGPGSPSQKAKLQPPGTQASRTDRACRVESRLGRWPGVQLVRADQPGSNAGDAPMLSGREPRQPCLAETARSHTRRKGIESLPPLALGPHPLSQSRTPPGQTDLPRRQAEREHARGLPGTACQGAAWRMTIPARVSRRRAPQARRQVLARAPSGASNPAKHGLVNPQRRCTKKSPFESRG